MKNALMWNFMNIPQGFWRKVPVELRGCRSWIKHSVLNVENPDFSYKKPNANDVKLTRTLKNLIESDSVAVLYDQEWHIGKVKIVDNDDTVTFILRRAYSINVTKILFKLSSTEDILLWMGVTLDLNWPWILILLVAVAQEFWVRY